ncbi:MAG: histidinol dehydrogenase [Armatimonadetes bacterium]|nr:histidinol dehydrogenase [Armatimonadota bacterium]
MSLLRQLRPGDIALSRWLDRRPAFDPALTKTVADIIAEVEQQGAAAVLQHTRRFDAPTIESLYVLYDIYDLSVLSDQHKAAIDEAIERVTDFHELQLETLTEGMYELPVGWGWRTSSHEDDDGEEVGMAGQRLLPMVSAGIYVPGGKADYPSSVVMNVVPAKVAGVARIVVATPPRDDGNVSPAVVYACQALGVEKVLMAGGASAIAAMALGFEGFARVDVIAGPGSNYVNEAKRQLWGVVGLDTYAGPSEICVVADDEANVKFAAADFLTQIEHAEDNVGLLVTTSGVMADKVDGEIRRQLQGAPRAETMKKAIADRSACVVARDMDEVREVVNRFAPEHLALHVKDPPKLAEGIQNAGAIMMGPYTPQSVGDYAEGPSHTLPTSGAARFASPVNVMTFLKFQSVSMLERENVELLAPTVAAFGEMEGLPQHAYGTSVRLEQAEE